MAQYINKSALVAEIKRLLDKYISTHTFNYGAAQDLNHLLSFIDTLEVKEADLNAADEQKQQFIDKCKEFCNRQTTGEYYNRRGVFQVDKYIDDMINFIKGE